MASHRRTAAAAVATILASVSLYPVFIGVAWFWVGCATVIVVALTGTLTRLRRLPVFVVLLAYAVALLLWLNFAFSNARSLGHLLPTPASLAALFDNAGQGFNEASKYAPPVPELRGMVLLAAAGIGIAALLTDLIAVRLESAALAGLPLLLLFTEPFTLSVSRGFLGTTIGFCVSVAGYLALLSSEGRDRIREWEHPNPSARDEPDTRTLAATGRRVGFASVVLALCLPLFIPGLHTTRLFSSGQPGIGGSGGGGSGSGGGGVGVAGLPDPNTQEILSGLQNSVPVPVLTYTSNDPNGPNYLPVYTLSVLDGSGWHLGPQDTVPASRSLPPAPGLTVSGSTVPTVTTDIAFAPSMGKDSDNALPVPYPATAVKASGSLTADKSTLMVFDSGVSLSGLAYTVISRDPMPSYQQLTTAAAPPASITANYVSVPPAYDSLRSLAQQETAGATTEIAKAVALQNWLTGGTFKYTLKAPTMVTAADLIQFLKVSKQGYCQQFSFAMAVLARLLGIPARVVIGYTSGTSASQQGPEGPDLSTVSDDYSVTTHDAHAWPELYFQGYGWLRFEPTPGAGDLTAVGQASAVTPPYTNPALTAPATGQLQATSPAGLTATPTGLPQTHVKTLTTGSGQQQPRSAALSPWAIVGFVVAGLAVVLAVAPWCTRRVVRRRRWRRRGAAGPVGGAGTNRADRVRARDVARAHAAWAELHDDLMDYGAPSQPSESPRTVAARAGSGLGLAAPARAALDRIAMAEERARYAPTPNDGSGLRADSTAVRRAIAAAVPREVRWRARLFPASVVAPALNTVISTTDLYRGSRRSFPWLRRRQGAQGSLN
jgi:transglutaminase-like putative cysteine protease/uncharacterized membrane protein YgcG